VVVVRDWVIEIEKRAAVLTQGRITEVDPPEEMMGSVPHWIMSPLGSLVHPLLANNASSPTLPLQAPDWQEPFANPVLGKDNNQQPC